MTPGIAADSPVGRLRQVELRRHWRQLNAESRWGVVILAVILVLSVSVPLLSPNDPYGFVDQPLQPPSAAFLFGTDHLGRDLLVRVFAAARLDIALAILGVSVPIVIGTFIGTLAGTTRNRVAETVWDGLVNALTAFPEIILVLGIVAMVGADIRGLLIAIWISRWAQYARIARAKSLALRDAEFVQAAQVLGYSQLRILVRHIMPNVFSEALAYALSDFIFIIVIIGGLSFLGLGVTPPTPEWGAMLAEGRLYLRTEPWLILFPGFFLSLTAIGVALLARGLERISKGEDE
ncbi:MAG: ABC transporter permease [Caldilineaceae bacterium SB0668_bin_21]|nr:ABC transporter permease [Rhodospirillaceae bacterium]MDE0463503.1 ABC transporter permease [Caldilineaceae bacterium]MXX24552.1 ABC transporter permease [Caldilineaceae bacterium SB0668_bin_21]MYC19857.1 ABC transporter permease [Caldilineaceae bacterium SB0662_bin_25]